MNVVAWVLDHLRLPPVEKLVLIALASEYETTGTDLSQTPVAKYAYLTGLSERSVRRALVALERQGYVERCREDGHPVIHILRLSTGSSTGSVDNCVPPRTESPTPPDRAPVFSREVRENFMDEQLPLARELTPATPRPLSPGSGAGFDSWYETYPRHRERQAAMKAYLRERRRGATYDDLARARDGYAREVVGREPQYIKYPASFLNGDWREYLRDEYHDPPKPQILGARMELLGTRECRLGRCDGSGWITSESPTDAMVRCACVESG